MNSFMEVRDVISSIKFLFHTSFLSHNCALKSSLFIVCCDRTNQDVVTGVVCCCIDEGLQHLQVATLCS